MKNCHEDTLEIIGHGAASFRYYPMEISSDGEMLGNDDAVAKKVVDLIDRAFNAENGKYSDVSE
jgi:hypothetical protein